MPPELTSLLARVEGVTGVVASGAPLPPFDVHCPMGSLPLALRTEPATIPADIPYLNASPERIGKWRERIERLPAPRVAIAWSGRVTHANDRNRSIALTSTAIPVRIPQTRIYTSLRESSAGLFRQISSTRLPVSPLRALRAGYRPVLH